MGQYGEIRRTCGNVLLEPLVWIEDGESHLRLSRRNDDVASGTHDCLVGNHNQCDMVDECRG